MIELFLELGFYGTMAAIILGFAITILFYD